MPGTPQPALVLLRGTPEYGRFLDKLQEAARKGGYPAIRNRTQLIDAAVCHFAIRFDMRPPTRARPLGANQHGDPGPPPGGRGAGRRGKAGAG
jgi:hypothetical protein